MKYLPKIAGILRDAGKPKFVVLEYEIFRDLVAGRRPPFEIDEERYLTENDDVRDAVKAGKFKSATEHYIRHGYFEGRPVKPAPPKREKPKLVSSQ